MRNESSMTFCQSILPPCRAMRRWLQDKRLKNFKKFFGAPFRNTKSVARHQFAVQSLISADHRDIRKPFEYIALRVSHELTR